jgi:molybdate transport system substrate-binding protein
MTFSGCGKGKSEAKQEAAVEPVTLSVFAAASLTEALNEIAEQYKASAPAVTLSFNFDSSGKLQTQIENGGEADVFFSAGQKQMDALVEQYIDTDTRKDLLVNEIVLITPEGSTAGITSFEDCLTDKVKQMSIGGEGVPVGQYTEEVFTFMKGWDKIKKKASLGTNVKEVLAQVESKSVDCGVVYATDAATAKAVTVVAKAPEGSHKPAVYPAAVLKGSANADAAKAFLNYLSGPEATAVFEKIGFKVVKGGS